MALFLRGNVWWMEYRTRKIRKVVSTGFRKGEKAKARAAWEAFRLGFGSRPGRNAMEGILAAIYGDGDEGRGLSLSAVWTVYEEWREGKGRKGSKMGHVNKKGVVERFVAWAAERGVTLVDEVSVAVARQWVVELGRTNKTKRTYCQYLGGIWNAVNQMRGGGANPWPAATPDPDGSSVRREAFTASEEACVLSAAREVGHGWWLASVISRWTGLRYGDVATLDWESVDLAEGVIRLTPGKTKRHGVRVVLPMSRELRAALEDERRRCDGEGFVLPEHGAKYPQPMDVPFSAVLEAAELADGKHTFHSWRHTFRTRLAEAGVADETAKRLGGWTNTAMAAHYDHASHIDELRGAVAAMESAAG